MSDLSPYVPVPRVVVEALVEEWKRELPSSILIDLESALVVNLAVEKPPWAQVRNMAVDLERLIAGRGPRAVHELDQLRATMRDELDKLEVSLHDPWALYHGLVWVGMMVELARNGRKNGAVDAETFGAIAEIATTIAGGLLEFLPPEARP